MRADELTGTRKRPFGVALIAAAQAAHALTVAVSWDPPANLTFGASDDRVYDAAIRTGIVMAGLVIALGLWWLKRWAWVGAMLWVGASMAGALLAYVNGEPRYPVMVLSIAVVFYLNQGEVQRAFRGEDADEDTEGGET